MSCFCLLSDPKTYVADGVDLAADRTGLAYWLDHFEAHFAQTLDHALKQYGRSARRQISDAGEVFSKHIESLRADPLALGDGTLSVISLCRLRAKTLRDHGINDAFLRIKQRENYSAIELYPDVIAKLGELYGRDRWLEIIRGLLAGNIFDLGSQATMHLAGESVDLSVALEKVKPRPWHVDDFDTLVEGLSESPPTNWGKAVIFVDNAGSDFVLGVMPLARELAMFGTRVVLAANELPSLNDMTVDETVEVVDRLAAVDGELAALIRAGMFEVVSSGNDIPLIDLSEVSDELNESSADADLLILEGMGRSIESNFETAFSVDTVRLAMLKDPQAAAAIGGQMFDCVCKYDSVAH